MLSVLIWPILPAKGHKLQVTKVTVDCSICLGLGRCRLCRLCSWVDKSFRQSSNRMSSLLTLKAAFKHMEQLTESISRGTFETCFLLGWISLFIFHVIRRGTNLRLCCNHERNVCFLFWYLLKFHFRNSIFWPYLISIWVIKEIVF